MTAPACPITVWDNHLDERHLTRSRRPCGLPAVEGIFCAQHEADRIRLGSQP